jgi:phasin family protein
MANPVNEQMIQTSKAAFDHYQAVTLASIEGLGKLAELNIATARASIEESLDKARQLMTAKDPKALADLGVAIAKPVAEQAGGYARKAYDIASETGSEIAGLVEKQIADARHQVEATVTQLAASAPAGSEQMVAFFKQAVGAANTAFEQINSAAKQAAKAAEQTVASAVAKVKK